MKKENFKQGPTVFLLKRIWILLLVLVVTLTFSFSLMLNVDKANFRKNSALENENIVKQIIDFDYPQADYTERMEHCKSTLVHWVDESGSRYVYGVMINKDGIVKADAMESVQCAVFKNMLTERIYYWCDESDVIEWLKENDAYQYMGKNFTDGVYRTDMFEEFEIKDIYISYKGMFIPGTVTRCVADFNYFSDLNSPKDIIPEEKDFSYLKGIKYIKNHEKAHMRNSEEEAVYIKLYKNYYGVPHDSPVFDRINEKCESIDHKKKFGDIEVFFEKETIQELAAIRTYHGTNVIQDNKVRYIAVLAGTGLIVFLASLTVLMSAYYKRKISYERENYRRNLVNNLAHDLKTPLTAMSGYAENLLDNVASEKRYHYAQAIKENADYMNEILVSALALSRTESYKDLNYKEVDLIDNANKLWGKYEVLASDKKIRLSASGSYKIKADNALINSMLDNLISNAIKYGKEDSTITMSGNESSFFIENETDIPLNCDPEKLWEPFEKGDNSRGDRTGSGLGLSIVKNICNIHRLKSRIACEGGKFRVTIS
ncbi:MAG: HAMP domain-containing histidine kinase [Lachnospiraceae bacterium]|nr:HAMP domain-containing histidine kinase [Lachnospiraceae bacterium]